MLKITLIFTTKACMNCIQFDFTRKMNFRSLKLNPETATYKSSHALGGSGEIKIERDHYHLNLVSHFGIIFGTNFSFSC